MKRISLLFFAFFIAAAASAQNRMAISGQTFRFGVRGAFNSTWMFNNNISDQGDDIDYKSAFGTSFGFAAIYNFTDESSISVDLLFATHNAEYQSKDETFQMSEKMSYIDIPILFRLGPPDGGGYVELGPMISFMSKVEEDLLYPPLLVEYSGKEVSDDFAGTGFSGILGFGYDFQVGQNLLISAGLRFGYTFTDATKQYEESAFVTDAESFMSLATHSDVNGNYNYEASHRAFGGLNIAILYRP